MNGKTHQVIGITFGVATAAMLYKYTQTDLIRSAAVIACSSLGSLLPDIDHTQSKAGRTLFFISYPIKWISDIFIALYNFSKVKVFKKLSEVFGHRGLFHSPLLWFLLLAAPYIFIPEFNIDARYIDIIRNCIIGLGVGILSHIFADMFNPTGVPILMPFTMYRLIVANVTTGSRAEVFVRCFSFVIFMGVSVVFLKNIIS